MPLQTFNFMQPIQTPDYSGLANIFQNYYKGMEAARTPQKLQQEELQRNLANQVLGTQAQYLPQEYQSQQQLREAQAREHQLKAQQMLFKQALLNHYFPELMSGSEGSNLQMGQPGQTMPPITPAQGQISANQSQTGITRQSNQLGQALLANLLDIDQPKASLNTENQLVTPNIMGGQPFVQQAGPTEEQRILKKGEAESRVKAIDENRLIHKTATEQRRTIDYTKYLTQQPGFDSSVGPVNSFLSRIIPNEELQSLNGQLTAVTNTMASDLARTFGKNVSENNLNFASTTKPSVDKDYASVFKGKLASIDVINNAISQGAEMFDELMKSGQYSEVQARKIVADTIDINGIIDKEREERKAYEVAAKAQQEQEKANKLINKIYTVHDSDTGQTISGSAQELAAQGIDVSKLSKKGK